MKQEMEIKQIRLRDASIGKTCVVVGMELQRATKMRLTALGMTKGTDITVLNNKKSGSVIFKVRGTRLAVGKGIAEKIFVREDR